VDFFDERVRALAEDEDDEELEVEDPFGDDRGFWVGGIVPIEAVLGRSDIAAVVIRGVVAYPDRFDFTLLSWVRRLVGGRERRGRRGWRSPLMHHMHLEPGEEIPGEFLRFGIVFPDGAVVTNLDKPAWELSPDATEPLHGLDSHSASGSEREFHQEYSAWPIPEGGSLGFVVEWPAYGIRVTRYDVDAGWIREAAGRAYPVWDDLAGPSRMRHHGMTGRQMTERRMRGGEGADDETRWSEDGGDERSGRD
jgi:hypothetical protein